MSFKRFFILLLLIACKTEGQTILKGVVRAPYENSIVLKAVEIKSSGGITTGADASGLYQIAVKKGDTIRYYYKQQLVDVYFYVSGMNPVYNVELNMDEAGSPANELEAVKVYGRSYTADSVQRRKNYADLYNYKDPKISMGDNHLKKSVTFMGETMQLNTMDKKLSLLDIGSMAQVFSFQKKKARKQEQLFALQVEQLAYIQHRYRKELIEKYGDIHSEDSLNAFIQAYTPTYDALKQMTDFEMYQYIASKSKLFKAADHVRK